VELMGLGQSTPRPFTEGLKKSGFDSKVKLVLVGDSGVGTSLMVMRFWDEQTAYQTYVSFGFQKAGVELNIKTLEFDGRRVRTELSDYSGHSPQDAIANNIYDSASAVKICFSVGR